MPSCARTLLRLMWALKFAAVLLCRLSEAFEKEDELRHDTHNAITSDTSLRWAVLSAYDAALAEHHSWTLRRSVKAACYVLPTKEVFIARVCDTSDVMEGRRCIERLAPVMQGIVDRMYAFYKEHDLLRLK